MLKLSLCAATALSLVACSCAVAMPLAMATESKMNGWNGGRGYRGLTSSLCPGNVCDTLLTSLAGRTGKLTVRNSTAMFWWEEGLGADRVAWSSEMLGPFITIDFGSTVNVKSRIVWADSTPGAVEGGAVGGARFATPAKLDLSRQAYTFSGLNLIGNSVDVKFSQAPSNWSTAGRVPFTGSTGSSVPRPATGLLVAGILITIGSLGRKRVNYAKAKIASGRERALGGAGLVAVRRAAT